MFGFDSRHNKSDVSICDFLAGVAVFPGVWLTGTNECCVYPAAWWSFADVTREQISIMNAGGMFEPAFVQFHTLYEMSRLGSRPNGTREKTTARRSNDRRRYETRALICPCAQTVHASWFWNLSYLRYISEVIYSSVSCNGEFLIFWPPQSMSLNKVRAAKAALSIYFIFVYLCF